ncbi:prokaryotic cytochrome b561 family protein [Novosphingobium sp. Rr 2-17]|nr:cytochrome b/b6 domain-containing protein [Novosphingobium sp. Rr 2-17]EIZ79583.1 prokaryotic cytochrome b561 family protein [Novosphingobium sp. Rr 2-17]
MCTGDREHCRYSDAAMVLHWLIALLIIAIIPMGIWVSNAIGDPKREAMAYGAFQFHKSIGLLLLMLTLVIIGWRLTQHVPPTAPSPKPWWRFLARARRAAFYGSLLVLPLSGWAYVSAGWGVSDQPFSFATSFFGQFKIFPYVVCIRPSGHCRASDDRIASRGGRQSLSRQDNAGSGQGNGSFGKVNLVRNCLAVLAGCQPVTVCAP